MQELENDGSPRAGARGVQDPKYDEGANTAARETRDLKQQEGSADDSQELQFLKIDEYSTANAGVLKIAAKLLEKHGQHPGDLGLCAVLFGHSDLIGIVRSANTLRLDGRGVQAARGRRSVAAFTQRWPASADPLLQPTSGHFVAITYARLAHSVRINAKTEAYLPARLLSHVNRILAEPFVHKRVRAMAFSGLDTVDAVVLIRADRLDDIGECVQRLRSIHAKDVTELEGLKGTPALFRSTHTVIGVPVIDGADGPELIEVDDEVVVADEAMLLTRLRFSPTRRSKADEVMKACSGKETRFVQLFGADDAIVMPDPSCLALDTVTWGQLKLAMLHLGEQAPGVASTTEIIVRTDAPKALVPSETQEGLSTAREVMELAWLARWDARPPDLRLPWSMVQETPEILRQVAQLLEDDPEGFASIQGPVEVFLETKGNPSALAVLYQCIRDKFASLARRAHPYRSPLIAPPLEGVGYQMALDAFEHVVGAFHRDNASACSEPLLVLDAPAGFHRNLRRAGVAILHVSSITVRHPFHWVASLHEASEAARDRPVVFRQHDWSDAEFEALQDLVVYKGMVVDGDAKRSRNRFLGVYGPALVTELYKQDRRFDENHELFWHTLRRLFLVLAWIDGASALYYEWDAVDLWCLARVEPEEVRPLARAVVSMIERIGRDLHWEFPVRISEGLFGPVSGSFDRIERFLQERTAVLPMPLLAHLGEFFAIEGGPASWLPFADANPAAADTPADMFFYPRGGIGFGSPDARQKYQQSLVGVLGYLADLERVRRAEAIRALIDG